MVSLSIGAAIAVLSTSLAAASLTEYPWTEAAISAPTEGRYLYKTVSGEPFTWVADTNWELFHRMNHTDVDLYLADRAAKGFTVIQAVLLSKYNVTTAPNFFGHLAINNSDPAQPIDAYFDFVDWATARAAEYGITICQVPVWGRYVSGGWYGTIGPRLFDENNAYALGRYLGKRYPGVPKMLGGDTNGFWANNVPQARDAWRKNPENPEIKLDPIEDTRGIWAAMMRGFIEEEAKQGYKAFVAFQPTSPWISEPATPLPYGHNYINGSLGTLSMDAVQSGHEYPDPEGIDYNYKVLTPWDSSKNYDNILQMRDQFPGPVMDVENHYEGANQGFNTSKPAFNASEVRHGFYPALLSGACGITYGSLPVQQTYENISLVASPEHYHEPQLSLSPNASWHEALHWPGAKQTGYAGAIFNDLSKDAFNLREPAREFLSSPQSPPSNILEYVGDRYIAAMITKGYYWVYSGWGDAFQVDLDGISQKWGQPGVGYTAQWYDPRTSKLQAIQKGEKGFAKGKLVFTPPSSGGVDYDWLLIIKSESC
ncbi:unnamed protein product [Clonostachys byssicola]|uniref:DUF4038 domain-containing protein n=1 Tax=Clonostachys byssicola TaxID=160290 RepID=A0A9N9UAC8_9HYPO|nr:unnamed protein product [Clonostachys byssicola]